MRRVLQKNPCVSTSKMTDSDNYINYEELANHKGFNPYRGGYMSDTVIVKAKLKELVKGYNVSGDFAEALDAKVKGLIEEAMKRAEGNSRKTVMAKDL